MTGNVSRGKQESGPWAGQQPYLSDIYGRAQGLADDQWSYYPGQTVAGRDAATTDAESMIAARARGGSPMIDAAQQGTLATIQGDRFNSNPYLDQTYDRAAEGVTRNFNRAVLPNLESRFSATGRMGSGAHEGALAEAGRGLAGELAGMATDIYGGDYTAERGRQMAATGAAPGMDAAGYQPAWMLGQVGAQRENYAQQLIDDLVQRYEWTQSEPYNTAARYSSLIGAPVQASTGKQKASGGGISI